ncbi:MAG: hypothetical protein JO092_02015 [Candidatus Eremiobacteraeota bacterium]|nr:hypothetical protein [Candidatus Eremiobacteraeota bacterium]
MVKVTGVAVGMCAIVFSDTHKNKARLPIKVVANLVGVYVADTDNNAVKKVAPDGTITTIGSGFGYPNGVAVDTLGNVYVADTHNNAIKKVAPNGSLTPIGSAFNGPYGVAVDSSGDVYVADTFNNAVKVVAPNGTITCVPATFTLSNCGTAGFSSPSGVAVEPNCSANCNVYVADDGNNAVKMVAPNGTITSIGSGFNHPDGVAVDAIGNVYVADSLNGAVKKVATNEVISCVPSTLTLSNCSTAGFKYPRGVAVDALGNVYVADTYNSAVRMVAPSGAIMVIGSGFNYPYSVTLDAARDPF